MLHAPLLVALSACAPVAAQEPVRPRALSTRVERAPVIDGRLDDEVWKSAAPIGELTQIEPGQGVPCSEATEVRFVHDAHQLYMAIRCFDSEPKKILATTKERDGLLEVDDRVEIVFDTFHDGRNAFFFQINADGSKGDALVTNNGADFNKPWDGLWDGIARVDELGWSAELALPFDTLNFAEGNDTWGFNIQRFIGRKREEARWANPSREHSLFNIYRAGELGGLTDIRQGIGLDVVPFFAAHWRNQRDPDGDGHADGGDDVLLGEPGFDLFYKLLPSLTFALTVNTDFAETEVDGRQINLTRFPLFFPERRDFFLQDAGLFQFGFDAAGGSDGGDEALIPFFSRRIGLSDAGEEVPIEAGTKLTGRAGPYGIGLLDVQTDSLGELDGQNLFAGRIVRNFGTQSTFGAIVTHGNPEGTGDNTVYGVDATQRASVFSGDRDLITTGFFLRSESDEVGDGAAFGLGLRAPGDRWSWSADALEIEDDFDAALGFVPRPGIRRYQGALDFQPRPELGGVRQLEFGARSQVITDTDGALETWTTDVQPFGFELQSGDTFAIDVEQVHDELPDDFEISDGVVIPAGAYDYVRPRAQFESASQRPLALALEVSDGDFYDGDRLAYQVGVTWRPSSTLDCTADYERNDVSLPGGDFVTELGALRANVSFTPELSWNNFVQWDNESDTLGIQSRLRWIPVPAQEVFLVFNETLESDSSRSAPLFQELSFKVSYTLRF